jgi:hypothetical protein
MSRVSSWLDEDYDKIPVEEAILGDSRVRGTTLRRPMVYGPGDPLHRFGYLKRMDDMRPHILLQEDLARLARFSRLCRKRGRGGGARDD